MKCIKAGFTPLKIATLVVTAIALVVHITAVVYPVWDKIDASWKPSPMMPVSLKIQASGSLWDFTIRKDETNSFFPPKPSKANKEWKEPIKKIALSSIGVGVVGLILVIISAFVDSCTHIYIIRHLSRMLTISALLCTSFEVLLGAVLYRYQYTKTTSNAASDLNKRYPIDEFILGTGWNLECAAGGLFLIATLTAFAESIHNSSLKIKNNSTLVTSFEESLNKKRTGAGEEKKQ